MTGDGSLGFGETDLLELHVHATSPDIGASLARLAERRLPVTGALEADARIRGSRLHPTLAGGFEVSNATARGVAVPLVVGSLESNGRELRLNDAGVDFSKGSLLLAGSRPFTIAPFSIGREGSDHARSSGEGRQPGRLPPAAPGRLGTRGPAGGAHRARRNGSGVRG